MFFFLVKKIYKNLQVWDVETDSIISTYTSPNFEGILSTIWSPIDSDCIISAIKDHTIRVWRISDCPPQEDIGELFFRLSVFLYFIYFFYTSVFFYLKFVNVVYSNIHLCDL